MDSTYVTAFVRSVQNVFETMLQMPVQIDSPALKESSRPSYDVSGIIGMSGDIEGVVILSFPTATAERVVSLFTGMELECKHEDFADAIGELVNMVSGGAKAQFTGKSVSISCPSVVIGSDHTVLSRKDMITVLLPCACECGEFTVEVSMPRADSGAAKQPTAAAVAN